MFNKKVWISLGLVTVLFVSGLLGFVIIPNALNRFSAATVGPSVRDSVSGNGGAAVMVGEFLYFTSGFTSMDELEHRQNNFNRPRRQGEGGIWRVRLPNGRPDYDNSHLDSFFNHADNNASELREFDRFHPDMQLRPEIRDAMDMVIRDTGRRCNNLELIVPKIAGWEHTSIWIFGDTLVYTTPNNLRDRHGQLQRFRTDFFRANLNGSGHRRIYTSRTENLTRDDYTVAWADGNPYLLVRDGSYLVRVDMRGRVQTISDTVTDAVFPRVTSYFHGRVQIGEDIIGGDDSASLENSYSGIMGYVFFTDARDEEATGGMRGNILRAFNIGQGISSVTTLRHDHNNHRLFELGNGHLLFETHFEAALGGHVEFYVIDDTIMSDFGFGASNLQQFRQLPLQQQHETALFVSGERTPNNHFRYITFDQTRGRLLVYNTSVTNFLHEIEEVSEVIAVNRSSIMFRDTRGDFVTVNNDGSNRRVTSPSGSIVNGARVTAFAMLDNLGQIQGSGYMFFYIRNITEIPTEDDGPQAGTDGEEESQPATLESINIGVIVDSSGRDFILARLDEKFIPIPENFIRE